MLTVTGAVVIVNLSTDCAETQKHFNFKTWFEIIKCVFVQQFVQMILWTVVSKKIVFWFVLQCNAVAMTITKCILYTDIYWKYRWVVCLPTVFLLHCDTWNISVFSGWSVTEKNVYVLYDSCLAVQYLSRMYFLLVWTLKRTVAKIVKLSFCALTAHNCLTFCLKINVFMFGFTVVVEYLCLKWSCLPTHKMLRAKKL